MADDSWHTGPGAKSSTAVLDMDVGIEELEMVDDDQNYKGARQGEGRGDAYGDVKQRMTENVTQMVWQAGTQSAKKAWSVYGNIDVLRPYFDVEPKEVQFRLLYSLIPEKPNDQRHNVPKELYGPVMVVLTLIALLLYQMKTADHRVEDGTLMGSAFIICFMYWFGSSALVWFVTYICNVRLAILQVLSMMGYALFGHCIVLFLGTVIHTTHDHMFFYFLWAVLGGLSTLRMASIIMSRTRGQSERLMVIGTLATLHLLFLLYLHFAYHTMIEEFSDAMNENLAPVAIIPAQQEVGDTMTQANQVDREVLPHLPEVQADVVSKELIANLSNPGIGDLPKPGLFMEKLKNSSFIKA